MAVVLDARVVAGVPLNNDVLRRHLGEAMDSGKCYITLASVAEFACVVAENCGAQLSEKWVKWLLTSPDIQIIEKYELEESLSVDAVLSVAEANLASGLPADAATSAALARRKRWPVLTNRPAFKDLQDIGFCEVRWADR